MNVRQGSDFSPNDETEGKQLAEKNILPPDAKELSPGESPEESGIESNSRISYRV
jgi:triphosphoribosyl-dephospho-CoA synthetase